MESKALDAVPASAQPGGNDGQPPILTDAVAQPDVSQGFSKKVLRYFLSFLQTDFKKQQAPRRRIQLKSDVGFRMGMPLRKYVSLYKAAWKFAGEAPEAGLILKVPPGKSPIQVDGARSTGRN